MSSKRTRGRPTKYKKLDADMAFRLCSKGATDKFLAHILNISKSTLNRWKHNHPYFGDRIKRGRMIACAEVAEALYQRAIGFETTETHTLQCSRGSLQDSDHNPLGTC